MKIPSNIPLKFATAIGILIIVVAGLVGFTLGNGGIYTGPSVPNFQIVGNGTTDANVSVHFTVRYDSIPPGTPSFMWFVNGNISTNSTYSTTFPHGGTYQIELRISMENNNTKKVEFASENVHPDPTVKAYANLTQVNTTQSVSFHPIATNGTGNFSYLWTASINGYTYFSSTKENYSQVFPYTGTWAIKVKATDKFGEYATYTVYVKVV